MSTPLSTADLPETGAERHLHVLLEFNRRWLEAEFGAVPSLPVGCLGIVGAGVMGAEIGAAALAAGMSIIVADIQDAALASLTQRIASLLSACRPPREALTIDGRIETTRDLSALGRCSLVLESVVENTMVKPKVLAALQPHLSPTAVLATNTSTIPIARLSKAVADPGRFCGIHFFHPVGERPLVEIVRGPNTTRETAAQAAGFAQSIGKVPLAVADSPGFLVNRFLMSYTAEGMELLMEGASMEAVDRAGEECGMALGPLRLLDEVGLDTALNCGWMFSAAFPDTVPVSPLLAAMVKAKRLGRKTGAGFYAYTDADGQPAGPRRDTAAEAIIARWAAAPRSHTSEEITARLPLSMVLEATRVLQDATARNPQSIDLGLLLGLGFSERRGGLLYWADAIGAARILEMLRPLESLGPRLRPTPLLVEMAREKRRFYTSPNA